MQRQGDKRERLSMALSEACFSGEADFKYFTGEVIKNEGRK